MAATPTLPTRTAGPGPCLAYLGPGAAGHFVKMAHNGIEYALEQLLAESYDLLHRGLGLDFEELAKVFTGYNQGLLKSYLVEITSHILNRRDEHTGQPLVALIQDVAGQKGTGIWTSKAALDLGIPVPTIDIAVAWRHLSALKEERVLRRASEVYDYNLDLATVTRVWRGGCIIRAALLEDILAAYRDRPDLPNFLLHPDLGRKVAGRQGDWREVVKAAIDWGLPAPALMASLAYLDAYRSRRLPANLIQAQRDYFGAHTYERVDRDGAFHTDWLPG
ncbi:MAG: hypothetical protein P8X58_12055 [Syntrophobacterales bacterium]